MNQKSPTHKFLTNFVILTLGTAVFVLPQLSISQWIILALLKWGTISAFLISVLFSASFVDIDVAIIFGVIFLFFLCNDLLYIFWMIVLFRFITIHSVFLEVNSSQFILTILQIDVFICWSDELVEAWYLYICIVMALSVITIDIFIIAILVIDAIFLP